MYTQTNLTTEQNFPGKYSTKFKPKSEWYVFYTAPRAEKQVYIELLDRGYEVFLPMTKSLRVWKNRQKKMIESVLFPSYIFVRTKKSELYNITEIPKIATYIQCAGKPCTIPAKEIEGIKKMLKHGKELTTGAYFNEGEKVKIISGPLLGHEGVLVKQKGKFRFGIQLSEINQTLLIDVCNSMLEKVL